MGTVTTLTAPAQHQAAAPSDAAVASVGAPSAVGAFTSDTPQGHKARIPAGSAVAAGTADTGSAESAVATETNQRGHRTGPGRATVATVDRPVAAGATAAAGVQHCQPPGATAGTAIAAASGRAAGTADTTVAAHREHREQRRAAADSTVTA